MEVQTQEETTTSQDFLENSNPSENQKLTVTDYTDKSFVVSGDLTKTYKDTLRNFGGRFNKNLKTGPGWVFSLKTKEKVMEFVQSVNSGEIITTKSSNIEIPSMENDLGLPTVSAPASLKYQYVKFKIFKPKDGMTVRLNTAGKTVDGVVTRSESSNQDGIVDTVYIDFDGQTSLGVISRSKWQIFGFFQNHTLYFQ